MTNCIFYSLFFVLFLNLSFGSLRLSQVNRAFMTTYKGMFEASVITVDEKGEPIYPYYSQPVLRTYISEYLEPNIKRYTTDYTLSIDFYLDDGVSKCDEKGLARCVKLNLSAHINYLFGYNKTQNFAIKDTTVL